MPLEIKWWLESVSSSSTACCSLGERECGSQEKAEKEKRMGERGKASDETA
jgi:hypothetical protein